jgi:hypothetical protein
VLFAFDAAVERPWRSIDDAVMGGSSRSEFRLEPGSATFIGDLSLDNEGGFASVRSPIGPWDLASCLGIELEVRGDGRRYKARLKNDGSLDGINYQASFDTKRDTWITVRLPWRDFLPVFRGWRVPDAPVLNLAHVATVGFLVADKQAGKFRLEVRRIAAYTAAKN